MKQSNYLKNRADAAMIIPHSLFLCFNKLGSNFLQATLILKFGVSDLEFAFQRVPGNSQ